jgi:heme/copper-type cytochrome/quinol oxidase subunit 2
VKVSLRLFAKITLIVLTLTVVAPLAARPMPLFAEVRPQLSGVRDQYTSIPTDHPYQAGLYRFQVGVWAANGRGYASTFDLPVTGASVEIQVRNDQRITDNSSGIFYWVGLDLPNDAFIQIGYGLSNFYGSTRWFWTYFPQGTASNGTLGVTQTGELTRPDGTWVKFSLESSGTNWAMFVDNQQVGAANLGSSDSGSNGPSAAAEIAHVGNPDTILNPVEFRNLQYRTVNGEWRNASEAASLCCYGVGSDQYQGQYPYAIQNIPGQNDQWITGSINLLSSNLPTPIQKDGVILWPWFKVVTSSPFGPTTGDGWYVQDTVIYPTAPQTVNIDATSRYLFDGWNINGQTQQAEYIPGITVNQDMILQANYTRQYLVQVSTMIGSSVKGHGWYAYGSYDTISVNSTTVPYPKSLGLLNSRFIGWIGSVTSMSSQETFEVTGPMTIQAIWILDPLSPLMLTIAFFGFIIGALTLRKKRQNRRADSSQSQCRACNCLAW